MAATALKHRELVESEDFLKQYYKGRREFSDVIVDGGKFEVCTGNAVSIPILLKDIKILNSTFKKVIFNNIHLINSRISGSTFKESFFLSSKFSNVDGNFSSFIDTKMYNSEIDYLNLSYSKMDGFTIEVSKINWGGLILSNSDITSLKISDPNLGNSGLQNIIIGEKTIMTKEQAEYLEKAQIKSRDVVIMPKTRLLSLKRGSTNY
ncbi:MAG: hypothetical protein ACP5M9_00490 [Candidatus Micrarchaeia archaeon]